jgi:ADP-ribosylglycohydrolase
MLGAIAGDVIGSVHEGAGTKRTDIPLWDSRARFTDDTVLTVAVAAHLLDGRDLVDAFHDHVRAYPHAGYGGKFLRWARERRRDPYGSWGNGSAMRVSPVGFAASSEQEAWSKAAETAAVTHDHPEGIRGARAVALAIFLARHGASKDDIRRAVERDVGYDLGATLDEIRPGYGFDVSCQGSVPESITAFLEADDYEDAVRKAISLGGDADTMACIAGGVAQAFYGGVPDEIRAETLARLDRPMREVVAAFEARFGVA